jgi:hypothetical protein
MQLFPIPVVCGLQPLDSWDGVFESRWGHGCSSLVFVVCCVGSGLCDELITGSEESNRLCVSVSDIEISTVKRPRPEMGWGATGKKNILLRTLLFGDYVIQWYPNVFPFVGYLTLLYNTATKTIKQFTIVLRRISVESRARLFFVRSLRKVYWALMCATVFT